MSSFSGELFGVLLATIIFTSRGSMKRHFEASLIKRGGKKSETRAGYLITGKVKGYVFGFHRLIVTGHRNQMTQSNSDCISRHYLALINTYVPPPFLSLSLPLSFCLGRRVRGNIPTVARISRRERRKKGKLPREGGEKGFRESAVIVPAREPFLFFYLSTTSPPIFCSLPRKLSRW